MSSDDRISELEIAHLKEQQDRSSKSEVPFKEYIDTRFENTLDVIKRASIGYFQNQIIGDGDEIMGVVLRSRAIDADDVDKVSFSAWFKNLMGTPQEKLGVARVQVLGTPHTDLYESPLTYDATPRDILRINNFPEFKYSFNDVGPLSPGEYVRGVFEKGTLRSGIITARLQDMDPLVLQTPPPPLRNGSFESAPPAQPSNGGPTTTPAPLPPGPGTVPRATTYSEGGNDYPAGIYKPYSSELTELLYMALEYCSLDVGWAYLDSTHYIISKESGGKVGVPNYTYEELTGRDPFQVRGIKNKPDYWPEVWDAARRNDPGSYLGLSTATGLGQLLSRNVEVFYPDRLVGIGDAFNEACGYVEYIYSRYGDPDVARSVYGVTGTYTNSRTGLQQDKTFREGY